MFHDDEDDYYDYDDDDDDIKGANTVAEIPDVSLLISLLIRVSCYYFQTGCAHRAMAYGIDRLCVSGQ
jgi:hypothetical protein